MRTSLALACVLAFATAAGAQTTQVIPLWPEGVPGAQPDGGEERVVDGRTYNVQKPTLLFRPGAEGRSTGTAVIICPGGGYARLAIANEGEGLAGFLQRLGVATFILKYRMVEYGHPAPLQDALRAVRVVRSRAAEFGVDPGRIGIAGASAGGHLAASAAALHEAPEGRTGAPLDAVSARPDFVALLYPVITLREPWVHRGSRDNLIKGDDSLVDRLSLDEQVRPGHPPVFLVHSGEDTSVPAEHSLFYYQALRKAGVPAEMHVYERGPHGFGIRAGLGTTSLWPERLREWLEMHGWLGK
jgi:acetyl esterase/lipase